jgi:hypothetical protein
MPDNFKFLELGVNALAEEKSAAAQRVIFAKMMLEDLRAQRLAAQGSNGVGG